MSIQSLARLCLVLSGLVVLQVTVLDEVIVFGAHPDVMVLVPAVGGIVAGAQRGAVVGFVAGLAADLIVPLPFGLSCLTFVLVGYFVGLIHRSAESDDSRFFSVSVLVVTAGLGTLVYAVIGALIGQPGMLGAHVLATVATVALGAVFLSYPVLRMVTWALSASDADMTRSAMPSGGSASR